MKLGTMLRPAYRGLLGRLMRVAVVDRLLGRAPLPLRVRDHVRANARRGDPASVLAAMDRYAVEERFLMNIGPEKGPLVQELVGRLPDGARVLELGAFCGYSSILWALALGRDGRVLSVEKSGASVEASRAIVEFAGLSDRVEFVHGASSDVIPTLEGPFDLVFLDHWKDLYEADLRAIEAQRLIRAGSVVVADNVGPMFDPERYLEYVRTCGHYETEHRECTIEYSDAPDAVEISVYRP